MATYCAKFIQNFSDITKSLRELTKKSVNFKWIEIERESFEQVKQMLTSDRVMAFLTERSKQSLPHMPHHEDYQPYCHKRYQVQMTKG